VNPEESFEKRLQRKLAQESDTTNVTNKVNPEESFEKRLQRKLSQESYTNATYKASAKKSFEKRLHRKLSQESYTNATDKATARGEAEHSNELKSSGTGAEQRGELSPDGTWVCLKCTFANEESSLMCVVCNEERGKNTSFRLMGIPNVFND
jgi:glucan-binding YG repeat protein